MVTRNQNPKRSNSRRGSVSVQMLVVLAPVLFGFMGFAFDLGVLYLVRGELNGAANSMATAAAAQLNGTTQGATAAANAARALLDDTTGTASRYSFGSALVGQTTGGLTSSVDEPALFATLAEAVAATGIQGTASAADGTTARHVTINMTGEAPLLFWSFLSLGQARRTTIAATAVAGVSAPLCQACNIEPFAVLAPDAGETTDFGFVRGNVYTLGMQCNGAPPALIAGTSGRIPYLIVNRFDEGGALLEDQQLFRIGAQGMLPTNPALACARIGSTEAIWATAAPRACAAGGVNASVQNVLCGVSTRFTNTPPTACSNNTDFNDLVTAYPSDTNIANLTSLEDFQAYDGNNRRIMTLPVVAALATDGTMAVIGFRQFILNPTPNVDPAANNPSDANGRFAAVYIGYPLPVKQGRTDGGCGVTAGPGKVVLHQ